MVHCTILCNTQIFFPLQITAFLAILLQHCCNICPDSPGKTNGNDN
jgi:hypothetical protein